VNDSTVAILFLVFLQQFNEENFTYLFT